MDTNSQAPGEPITQQDEVAAETTEQVSPQEQQRTEQPLTRDDVLALMREVIPQAVQPLIQSQVAKGENRINQRIAERFAALEREKGTLNLSEDQVRQARKAIIEDEQMNAFAPQNPQAQGGNAPTPSAEQMDPGQMVSALNQQAFALGGIDVHPNDKEWLEIIQPALDDPNGSPYAYLVAATDASRMKAQRLKAQKEKAPGRVTGSGGGASTDNNDISSVIDSTQLYEMGEARLRNRR